MPKTCKRCGARLTTQASFCSHCGARQGQQPRTQTRKKRGQRLNISLFTLLVGILLLAASAIAYLSGGSPPPATAPALPPAQAGLLPYPEVERIDLLEAKTRHDDGTAIFLDVRIAESYQRAHISDALSIPLALLPSRHQQLAATAEILIYCS